MLHVTKFGSTIDHHVDKVTRIRNYSIINDATTGVGHKTQTSRARCQSTNVTDDDLFQKSDTVLAMPADLWEK
jgi:hypothetical protein